MKNYFKPYILIFMLFTAAYVALLLIYPQIGVVNDDVIFLRTIQSGKPLLYYSQNFPYYDSVKYGRFTPLGGLEYNLALLVSKSPSPFWYFLYHAIQFVIFIFLLGKLISKFTSNRLLRYGIPILFALTPVVIIPWFRLQLNERNVALFLVIFLLFYLNYLKKQRLIYLISGIIFANMAIYYKETAFIAIGTFAFFHLILSWRTINRKIKIFDGLLFLSAFIYITIYYFYVYQNHGPIVYANPIFNIYDFVKYDLLNYSFSDPILILLLLPLTFWRAFKVFVQRHSPLPLYDSLLIAASMYVVAFFTLNIYTPYYLLPAYILAVPPLIFFVSKINKPTLLPKTALIATGFILLFNVLPSGIHYLTYLKYAPNNFNKMLDSLVNDIKTKHPDERANIFLDSGNHIGPNQWDYFVLAEFLEFKGLSVKEFDLKTNIEPALNNLPLKIRPPYSVFLNPKSTAPLSKGDYLIVLPSSQKNIGRKYSQSLLEGHDLVFKTKSRLTFPMLTLKEGLRYLISVALPSDKKLFGLNRRKLNLDWPDYYVFIQK